MNKIPDWLVSFITAAALMVTMPAFAGIIITSKGSNGSYSSFAPNVVISASGGATTASTSFNVSGSVSASGAFGGTIGVGLTAMANVSTNPLTLGDQLTGGSFDRDATYLGVAGGANAGGIGYATDNREGIALALNTSVGISPTVGVRITAINVQNVGRDGTDPVGDESFWIVNLLTRQSLHLIPVPEVPATLMSQA